MDNKQFRIGSVTVLFAVILLCVSIFAALTVAAAVADRRTALRYGDFVARETACENAGQEWLAAADAYRRGAGELPENTGETDGTLSTVIKGDGVTLTISLDAASGELLSWQCSADWQPEEPEWNLWQKGE